MLLSVSCMPACNVLTFLPKRLRQDKSSLLGSNLVMASLEFDLSNTMPFLCSPQFLMQVMLQESILM